MVCRADYGTPHTLYMGIQQNGQHSAAQSAQHVTTHTCVRISFSTQIRCGAIHSAYMMDMVYLIVAENRCYNFRWRAFFVVIFVPSSTYCSRPSVELISMQSETQRRTIYIARSHYARITVLAVRQLSIARWWWRVKGRIQFRLEGRQQHVVIRFVSFKGDVCRVKYGGTAAHTLFVLSSGSSYVVHMKDNNVRRNKIF